MYVNVALPTGACLVTTIYLVNVYAVYVQPRCVNIEVNYSILGSSTSPLST